MSNVQNLQKEFEKIAISWGEGIKQGNRRMADKHALKYKKMIMIFRKDKHFGKSVLIPLFAHPEPAVRLLAAVRALDLDVQIEEAENVITEIANNPEIRVIRIMAQINLDDWNRKKGSKK